MNRSLGRCMLVLGCAGVAAACSSDNSDEAGNTAGTAMGTGGTSAVGAGGRAGGGVGSGAYSANSMGFVGCSMAENVAAGYRAVGGTRMWANYGVSGMVLQSWTSTTSSAWSMFDGQVQQFGSATAVWVQICIFVRNGATYDEVKELIANARQHAPNATTIYITGQPLYDAGHTCFLAGSGGPELTDSLAQQAGNDSSLNVIYPGQFHLHDGEDQDGCHANPTGQQSLGQQALAFWG